MFDFNNNFKRFLILALVLIFLLSALPAIIVLAGDSGPSSSINSIFAGSAGDGADFIWGEVLAPAASWENAREVAASYGLELKSYAWGIAVLAAPDPLETVAKSNLLNRLMGSLAGKIEIPKLSLNRLYSINEAGDKYALAAEAGGKPEYKQDPGAKYDHPLHKNNNPARPDESPDKVAWEKFALFSPSSSERQTALAAGLFAAGDSRSLWHHELMDTERAWNLSLGEGTLVAVIDTGIDISHPKFAGRISEKSYNSSTGQLGIAYVQDDAGHGTHVSGIIAASLEGDEDVCGVAPKVTILTIKANIPSNPNYFDSVTLYRAINYATENGADIINMSLGRNYGGGEDELEHNAIINALAKGATVICAAGNERDNHAGYPAAYPEAIAVSALRWGGVFENSYSNYGPEIDIAAPGSDIYSTANGGGYESLSGTSMASPNAAGVAALIKSLHPEYTPGQVRDQLCETARAAGALGKNNYYGWGIVNAYGAVLGIEALHRVIYDFNDGEREPVWVPVTPGNKLIEPYSPTSTEFIFAGWYTAAYGGEKFNFADPINQDMTLYARWVDLEPGMYAAEFPDPNFCREVLKTINASDGGDRGESDIVEIDLDLLASIEYLNVDDKDIYSMTGLKYFSGLKILSCIQNQLRELDISANPKLQYLYCNYNHLVRLDLSEQTELYLLACFSNQLTELDLSNNLELQDLQCDDNQIAELDISGNKALRVLWSGANPLRELDLANNPALEYLLCSVSQLTELDVSNNPELIYFYCHLNQIRELDLSKNPKLKELWCSDNNLKELDISNNPDLKKLLCLNNQLESLDLSHNPDLTEIWCFENRLTELDLANNLALNYLFCYNNRLQEVDLSNNAALTRLDCCGNLLEDLDLSNNPNLEIVYCHNNRLENLDFSENPALWELHCNENRLNKLDLTKNTALSFLDCDDNRLTELNIANNPWLQGLFCSKNQLKELDVSNNPDLKRLDCSYNFLPAKEAVTGLAALESQLIYFMFYPQYSSIKKVNGKIRSYNPFTPTFIQLRQGNREICKITIDSIPGNGQVDQDFVFNAVVPGIYDLVITKDAHTKFTILNLLVEEDLDLTLNRRPEVCLMALRCGDINGDGLINDADLTVLWRAGNYNKKTAEAENEWCDLNGDGLINDADLTILWLAYNYNRGDIVIE